MHITQDALGFGGLQRETKGLEFGVWGLEFPVSEKQIG
jgi:hypothetical protein